MSLSRKFKEWTTQPHAVSKVYGFTVSLTKRSGALLKNPLAAGGMTDNSYYEVTLQSNGRNPEYPHGESRVFRFTHAVKDGYALDEPCRKGGDVAYLAHDRQFIAFELVEEKAPPVTQVSGKETPGYHALKLKMIYLGKDGLEKQATFDVKDWVRQSDMHAVEGGAEAASDRLIASATVLQDKMAVMKTLRLKKQGGYVAVA